MMVSKSRQFWDSGWCLDARLEHNPQLNQTTDSQSYYCLFRSSGYIVLLLLLFFPQTSHWPHCRSSTLNEVSVNEPRLNTHYSLFTMILDIRWEPLTDCEATSRISIPPSFSKCQNPASIRKENNLQHIPTSIQARERRKSESQLTFEADE